MACLWLGACRGALQLEPSDADVVLAHHALEAPDPSRPGPFRVRTLYYGSGTDRHRAVYRDSVAMTTPSVDASKLVDLGSRAGSRNEYWGFTPEAFPLNGRVWYPEGEGPFPLVLVVHGNHDMKDFSDPGYEYLGKLLASRGFILASVDMNFVNGAIRGENDARGWLLLQHLRLWREWSEEEGNPFRGKVDTANLALVGHSRGGEAVGHAAAFNRLSRYPDDASLAFDFGFSIRALVAIAPVDGQYLPADQRVPVRDVSYLVFHGSHDGDVSSFHGLRQYGRVRFTEPGHFKAAVYVYRANHGQWNSVWGAFDNGPRSPRILDLRGLLPPEDQRRFAEVYVTAFLEATLKGEEGYLPLFRDHRVAGDWLPPTMYVTRFHPAGFRPLATFEEDIDVTSGTEEGVRLRGDGLAVWREGELVLRSSNRPTTSASQENQAVWLGWRREDRAERSADPGPEAAPSFRLVLSDGLAERWSLDADWTLDLDLAPTHCLPGSEDQGGEESEVGAAVGCEPDEDAVPVDLTVEVIDGGGARARVPLSRYGAVRRPLETSILRRKDLERERFARRYEVILQTYVLPLADFTAANPQLDPADLREVRLVFDRTRVGEVVLDDVGLARLDPAFLEARVDGGP